MSGHKKWSEIRHKKLDRIILRVLEVRPEFLSKIVFCVWSSDDGVDFTETQIRQSTWRLIDEGKLFLNENRRIELK